MVEANPKEKLGIEALHESLSQNPKFITTNGLTCHSESVTAPPHLSQSVTGAAPSLSPPPKEVGCAIHLSKAPNTPDGTIAEILEVGGNIGFVQPSAI